MVGEEVEQLWYMLSGLIKTGRVSSGPRRSQSIDASGGWRFMFYSVLVCTDWIGTGQYLTRRSRERIGYNISRRWKTMLGILQENDTILQRVVGMIVPHRTDKSGRVHFQQTVTLKYLDDQSADQIIYYRDYRRYVLIRFSPYWAVHTY
jgi:hypothetical protein